MSLQLRYLESFDGGDLAAPYHWDSGGLFAAANTASYGTFQKGGRLGDNAGTAMGLNSRSTDTTQITGTEIYVPKSGQVSSFMLRVFNNGGGYNGYLVLMPGTGPNGEFEIRNAAGTRVGGVEPIYDEWFYLEQRIDTVAGSWELMFNGTQALLLTGQNFNNSYPIHYGWGGNGSSDINEMWMDNLYIGDTGGTGVADYLEEWTVEKLAMATAGAASDFVGSDGNSIDNHLLVNADPVDVATWVESATIGDVDLYGLAALADSDVAIAALQVKQVSSSPAIARTLNHTFRIGGTDYEGSDVFMTIGQSGHCEVFPTNPATGSPWLASELASVDVGVTVGGVVGAWTGRLADFYTEVLHTPGAPTPPASAASGTPCVVFDDSAILCIAT